MFSFFGCDKKAQSQNDLNGAVIEISVMNKIKTADIWILPDTEKNRKTTVWGKATFPKLQVQDNKTTAKITSDADKYIVNMIDIDKMYYSAVSIELEEHQSIVIREGDELMSAFVDVYSDDGAKLAEYEMFVARL